MRNKRKDEGEQEKKGTSKEWNGVRMEKGNREKVKQLKGKEEKQDKKGTDYKWSGDKVTEESGQNGNNRADKKGNGERREWGKRRTGDGKRGERGNRETEKEINHVECTEKGRNV